MSQATLPDFGPLDELPEFTRTAILNLLARGTDIRFDNITARLSHLGIDVLADLSWEETRGSGDNRRTVTIRRTIVFFHRPESKLPDFTITHHEGFLGRLFASRSGSVEAPALEFKDRESFTTKYTVQSPVPVSARTLFDDSLVAALDVQDGMDVVGDQNGIMAWRDGDDLLEDDRRVQLAIDASAVFLQVVNDPNRGTIIADSNPGSYMAERIARLKADDSSTARALLKMIITREQVEEFLAQPTPRTVPDSIVRRVMGMNRSLIIAGLVMLILCGGLGVLGLVFGQGFTEDLEIILIFLGLALIGCVISLIAWNWRRKRLRLLRGGRIVDAHVVGIEAIDEMSDKEVLHMVTFQTTQGDAISMSLRSDATRIARQMMHADVMTRVLIDSEVADFGVWLDGWIVENIPD